MDADLKPALESSKGRSGPWGGARLVNAFAELSDGDKASLYSVQAIPGLTLFADVDALPVRGAHRMGSTLYAVVGTSFCSIASDGTAAHLGTLLGNNPVRMADNGSELAIQDGDVTGYVWSGGALVNPVNLPSVTDVCFYDGYFVWSIANSDQFIISGIDDGITYDPLDVATAEGAPDQLIGLVNDHRELLLLGTDTIEVWYDTGDADFPFERVGFAFIERGCIDRNSVAKMDNSSIFVGDDRIVYRMNGYQPTRLSTHAVERTLDDASWFRAFTYSEEGHKFYVLNTDLGTFAYDVATQSWHERKSFGMDYYRVGGSIEAYGQTIFTDNQTGLFYTEDLDTHDENGDPIQVLIQLPPIGDGVNRRTLYSFEVFMETGVGDLITTDPQMILQYSKDGGRNWSHELWRSMGAQGQYRTRAVWRNLGEFRQIQLRLMMPEKVRRCVLAYHGDLR